MSAFLLHAEVVSAHPAPQAPPDGDVNLGARILILTWIEASAAMIFLGARIYTRVKLVRNMGWDDWTMLFAMLLSLVTSVFVTLEVYYGVGRHAFYLSEYELVQATKMVWMTEPFSTMSACFGKISVVLLLIRVMNRNKLLEAILWFLIVTLFLTNLAQLIITFAQCTPVWALWNRGVGTCWDPAIQGNTGYFQAAYSTFADVVLALFPIFILWNLQMSRKVKAGLVALMSLGIFAAVAAGIKTYLLKDLAQFDFTFGTVSLVCWYTTEDYVIVIAACIPTLKHLFVSFTGKTFQGSKASRASGSKSNGFSSNGKGSRPSQRGYQGHDADNYDRSMLASESKFELDDVEMGDSGRPGDRSRGY